MTMAGRLQGLNLTKMGSSKSSPGVPKSARTPRVNYRSASVRIQGLREPARPFARMPPCSWVRAHLFV
jgi:hypothetical protein